MIPESLNSPQMSFEEFKKNNPEIAKAGEMNIRYRELANLSHDFFFDEELYALVKTEVDGDVFNHQGSKFFELYIKERRAVLNPLSDIDRQPGGEQHLPPALRLHIKLLEEELDNVKADNPQIEGELGTILETIVQTGITQLDRTEIITMLKKNIYLIPAVSIAYEIHFYSERLKSALDKSSAVVKQNDTKDQPKGGAAERARQYRERNKSGNQE